MVIISMTGNPDSSLGKHSDINLDVSIEKEACPLGLAPTSSTTAALVMGDALAVSLLETRGFTKDDFARSHPAGALGRKLFLHIADVMHSGDDMPRISPGASVSEAIVEMTGKRLGLSAVVDTDNRVLGVFTDGDLRRALDKSLDPHQTSIEQVMTVNPKTISPHALAAEAVQMMQSHKIQGLLVVGDSGELEGVLNFHDLLGAGIV
jgi:arabinose-5-phosphate isomerase